MTKTKACALTAFVLPTLLAWILCVPVAMAGENTKESRVIALDTFSFWRWHATMRVPMVVKQGQAQPVSIPEEKGGTNAKWLYAGTPALPEGCEAPDFDDSGWARAPGQPFGSPFVAQLCARGRFEVKNPGEVKDARISLQYHGGIVVFVNGKEIARQHQPQGPNPGIDTLAEGYPDSVKLEKGNTAPFVRTLEVTVPTEALRPGCNILVVKIFRAPYRIIDLEIDARSGRVATMLNICYFGARRFDASAGLTPNAARPAGFQAWNSHLSAEDYNLDWGDPNEPLRPVRIVGARNGDFCGKVMVGSNQPIKGLTAQLSDLVRKSGAEKIPAAAAKIRYAVAAGPGTWRGSLPTRHPVSASRIDALLETPPAEIKCGAAGAPIVPGATAGVWVIVTIPSGAKGGDYSGTLSIQAEGAKPIEAAVQLKIHEFDLPEDYRLTTFVDVVPSPETLALHYKTPLWSDDHFRYIARTFAHLRRIHNRLVYLPLIARTNLGNAQSMVRWTKQGEEYGCDWSIVEKYLDVAVKEMGKPEMVCAYVVEHGYDSFDPKKNETPKPVPATAIVNGQVKEDFTLPPYADPKAPAAWKPAIEGLKALLAKRGLEKNLVLGCIGDFAPRKETITMFKGLAPEAQWVTACHVYYDAVHGQSAAYRGSVWDKGAFPRDPSVRRNHGWQSAYVHFPRSLDDGATFSTFRNMAEMNVAGQQKGFVRLGADFWPALKSGNSYATIAGRYPETVWRNLNVKVSLLAPDKDGPVATARFEMLREGMQETEARIVLDRLLVDKDGQARLGPLAAEAQAILDERVFLVRNAVSNLQMFQVYNWPQLCYMDNCWWQAAASTGQEWYASNRWQELSDRLYAAAAAAQKSTK